MKHILVTTMAILISISHAQGMETGAATYEEDPTIALMKKTWELRGRITQLSKPTALSASSDCKKFQELNSKLDALATLISEAQYLQYMLQNLIAKGNGSLAHVRNEIEELEKQKDKYYAYMSMPHDMLPQAKL